MFSCDLCNKKFVSKQRLQYHKENQVCSLEKFNYMCIYCTNGYKHKQSLSRHMKVCKKRTKNRNLTKCSSQLSEFTKEIPSQKNELPHNPHKSVVKSENKINMKYCCEYCFKAFTRKDNLVRHKKKYCERIKDKVQVINNITNNITNITNNNTINNVIQINSLGNENLDFLTKPVMLEIINKCYNSIKELLQRVNIDNPQNRNLYLPNIKDSFIYKINDDNKWVMDNLDTTLNSIKTNKVEIIKNFIDENPDLFINTDKIKFLKHMMYEINYGDSGKKIKQDLKLLLINNKEILKKNFIETLKK